MPNYLTTEAAAKVLGVSTARVRKLIKDGRLPGVKRGRDLFVAESDVDRFNAEGRKGVGRPKNNCCARRTIVGRTPMPFPRHSLRNGTIFMGDALEVLPSLPTAKYQSIIADPPYFQVLLNEDWDNSWQSAEDYLEWSHEWVQQCRRLLTDDGLLFIFGQLGKREHVWLHLASALAKQMQFHDMLIWDRMVGYNERYDSFTPQYEMILVLRKHANSKVFFDKDAVRLPYDEDTIKCYLRDKRYKDKSARERHLRKGKYATNILRIPSLKGSSKEKAGHPAQKPISLIRQLIAASTKEGDSILDPFLGSGTTAVAAEELGRKWDGIEISPTYVEIAKGRLALEAPAQMSLFPG